MKTAVGIMVATCALGLGTVGCSHEEAAKRTAPKVVEAPTPPPPAPQKAEKAPEAPPQEVARQDTRSGKEDAIYFDFDSHTLRDDSHPVLQDLAQQLKKRPSASVRIEGNCDELGTTEYNLALGEERAKAAKQYLTHLGVPPKKIETVSYGSERPKYEGHNDDAHAKNRRDDFVIR